MIERRLESLKSEVLEMHELAKRSVEICLEGLRGDEDKRKECARIEQMADVLNTDMDFNCVTAIALFQPVARDLRFIISMMKISSSYERITDLAQEIAMYECSDDALLKIFEKIRENLLKMFEVVERGYEGETENLRKELLKLDDQVDRCYVEAMEYLANAQCSVDMILVARHLERIGDLLGKIGARIIFIEEGRRVWIK
jgi:phosphate transport system protein